MTDQSFITHRVV